MDGLELVRDTEGDVQSNSEQFDQEEYQLQQQEAHWEVLQAQGSEDQVDEVRLHTTEEFQSDQTQEGEKQVDQTDEKQVEQREDIGKLVLQEEAEKQVDQNGEVEQQVDEKEEVDEQVEEEKGIENQTDQEEEVERNFLQEDEVENVEQVDKEQQLADENQAEQEKVNEHLHHTEYLNLDQESEKKERGEFQEDFGLKEKEPDFEEEYKELVTQNQEEPANDKVHLIKQEEQTNHKKKDTKKSDQKITVDWIDRNSKGVPLYRRKSISESRQKWEVLEKQQHQPNLDNNRNHRERGEKIKFIEKELHSAGIIMAEAKTSRFGGTNEKCAQCNRTVYAMEKMEVIGRVMHKTCFRCSKCNSPLSVGRFSVGGGNLYCLTHYKQAFREKGTYDVFTPDNPCKGKWQQNADTPEVPKAQE